MLGPMNEANYKPDRTSIFGNKKVHKMVLVRNKPKLIYGIGKNDADYVTAPLGNEKQVVCPFYRKWAAMLERCYSDKYHKTHPTYIGCTVDPEWHSFMKFRDWMIEQNWKGKQLDKDVLNPGNRIYSPKTCVFVSSEINSILNTKDASRGGLPLGVSPYKCLFQATMSSHGKRKHLGYSGTPKEAAKVYAKAKSAHIREVAREQTDPRIKSGLLRHADLFENGETK